MNIRVDTVLPPPPEPTKVVVLTLTLDEARILVRYMSRGSDAYYSPEEWAFLTSVESSLQPHV